MTLDQFTATGEDGKTKRLTEMPVHAAGLRENLDDKENILHMVPVRWIKTVPEDQAIRETGFFGNQNSVCKPRTKRWTHTVERLKKRFGVE